MSKALGHIVLICLLTGCGRTDLAPHSSTPQDGAVDAVSASPYTFKIVRLFDLGRRDVRNFAFCSATRQLFISHLDKKDDLLYQWDVDSQQLIHTYQLGSRFICDNIAVSPDGRHLLVGCWPLEGSDCKTLLIDTKKRRVIHDFKRTDKIFDSRFSSDGKALWMRTSEARDKGVAFQTDGTQVESFSLDAFPRPGPQNIWTVPATKNPNVKSGLFYRDSQGGVHRLTRNHWHDNYGLTSDGKLIAATNWDDEIVVWNAQTQKVVFRAKTTNHDNGGGYLAYDSKHNRFLIGDSSYNGTTWLRALVVE